MNTVRRPGSVVREIEDGEMSKAELERFVSDARSNQEFLAELSEGVIGLSEFVSRASAKGYDFSIEEAKDYMRTNHHPELSDDELESVVGGGSVTVTTNAATAAEAVTAAVEVQTAATTTTVGAEAEVAVVAVGVIVAS
jgi:predicted ribosomally synthesized peptide with nif11-like leader